jgi:hypothetical protein
VIDGERHIKQREKIDTDASVLLRPYLPTHGYSIGKEITPLEDHGLRLLLEQRMVKLPTIQICNKLHADRPASQVVEMK